LIAQLSHPCHQVPDYRGPNGAYSKGHSPITYQQFVNKNDTTFRQRYWLRSVLGWPSHQMKKPNEGHIALNRLLQDGHLKHIITQNVDGLHHLAARDNVESVDSRLTELHGRLRQLQCLSCSKKFCRNDFQTIALVKRLFFFAS
jgi:NAD-dependent deacetylase sirtuin 4